MRYSTLAPALALAVAASPAAAQPRHGQHGGGAHHGATGPSAGPAQPYAPLTGRRVKALSEEQAADLLAGRGMALALAAELNGYPGPMHVLEHADALGLTPEQRARAEGLRAAMLAEARPLGARIVALEEELDALFARGEVDAGRLAALTAALGATGGRLREAHLAAHIGMREALSPAQRAAYDRLRGYLPR
jgi:Spy/CpxP family protein refolding chaperone